MKLKGYKVMVELIELTECDFKTLAEAMEYFNLMALDSAHVKLYEKWSRGKKTLKGYFLNLKQEAGA